MLNRLLLVMLCTNVLIMSVYTGASATVGPRWVNIPVFVGVALIICSRLIRDGWDRR